MDIQEHIQDDGTIQYDMSLPNYLDLPIKEDNIITTIFDNWNMTDFTINNV